MCCREVLSVVLIWSVRVGSLQDSHIPHVCTALTQSEPRIEDAQQVRNYSVAVFDWCSCAVLSPSHFTLFLCCSMADMKASLPLQAGRELKPSWLYLHKILESCLQNASTSQPRERGTEELWASSSGISPQLPFEKINSTKQHFTSLMYNFPWDQLQQEHLALLQQEPQLRDPRKGVPRGTWSHA